MEEKTGPETGPEIGPDQSSEQDPLEIARMAYRVATVMTTSTQGKKHGSYLKYRDERVAISLDSYVPNIEIWDTESGDESAVYRAAYHNHHNPYVFIPGDWTSHLAALNERALKTQTQSPEQGSPK